LLSKRNESPPAPDSPAGGEGGQANFNKSHNYTFPWAEARVGVVLFAPTLKGGVSVCSDPACLECDTLNLSNSF